MSENFKVVIQTVFRISPILGKQNSNLLYLLKLLRIFLSRQKLVKNCISENPTKSLLGENKDVIETFKEIC